MGGSDAGVAAALAARDQDPRWDVTVALADRYPNFSICGLTIDGVNDLDLSYTPPYGSPWDAVQTAAQAWSAPTATPALSD